MKRTLKRELKVREIAKRETLGTSVAGVKSAGWETGRCTFALAGQHRLAAGIKWCGNVVACNVIARINVPALVEACIVRMLTKWCQSTRLETRTKESNMYASTRVSNSGAQ